MGLAGRAATPISLPAMPPADPKFQESNLRNTQIRDLGLRIEDTPLEPIVARFQQELDAIGFTKLKPQFYLSTEWGVPFQTVSIGIPFYLARPELVAIQAEQAVLVEGAGEEDIMRYLRHEMGHVVNYAYRLYDREDWIRTFGSITQPYVEEYRPSPFSRRYVRHLPGWYAQKHPDEDWAETFAVWMTPPKADATNGQTWREIYANWPTALAKLNYCDRVIAEVKDREPLVRTQERDEDVADLTYSVHDYYQRLRVGEDEPPAGVEGALTAIFEQFGSPEEDSNNDVQRKPAGTLIRRIERDLALNVFRWTGHFPEHTRPMLRHLAKLADDMQQVYPADRENEVTVAITTLVTALAMNYVHRGTYLP
jgi:hypothetical protein